MAFNLNIDNYSVSELEELLSIQSPYLVEDIKNNQKKLKKLLLNKESMGNTEKTDILLFLDNVHDKLVSQNLNNPFLEKHNDIIQQGENFIIQRPSVEVGLNAKSWEGKTFDSSSAPPGYINPINIATIQRTINIDTRFREQYYQSISTNFNVVLPETFTKVISMRLASIEIPLSFHAISKSQGNNSFTIKFLDCSACDPSGCTDCYACDSDTLDDNESDVFLIQLPDGNYENRFSAGTRAAFIDDGINYALKKAINLQSGEIVNLYDTKLIRYTVDRVSGRSVFALNKATDDGTVATTDCKCRLQINFNVNTLGCIDLAQNLQYTLGWQLGYRAGVYKGASIISEGICYTVGPRYIYLCIDDFNNNVNNYFTSAFAKSVLQKDILARVNLANVIQSDGIYKSGSDDGFSTQINRSRSYFGPVTINRLKISLLDEYGRILNLNSMDWSFALAFECCYD